MLLSFYTAIYFVNKTKECTMRHLKSCSTSSHFGTFWTKPCRSIVWMETYFPTSPQHGKTRQEEICNSHRERQSGNLDQHGLQWKGPRLFKSTTPDILKRRYKNTLCTEQNTPSLLDAWSLKIPVLIPKENENENENEKEKESVRTTCWEESTFTRLWEESKSIEKVLHSLNVFKLFVR